MDIPLPVFLKYESIDSARESVAWSGEQVMSELEKNENINKDECPFSWKNYFRSIWDELFLMVRYNLMFLLCCIPVVTIPAAITAMHHVFVRVAGEKSQVLKKMPCRYSNGNSEDPYSQGF